MERRYELFLAKPNPSRGAFMGLPEETIDPMGAAM